MSFIRPEILDFAQKHKTGLAYGGIASVGALLLWRGLSMHAPLLSIIGGALIAVSATMALADRQRARFKRATDQPGVVQIDEAQISYFGPDTGGIVDRDALTRVDLVSSGDGVAHWQLSQEAGPQVAVPLAAEGAEALVDVLMTLPGVQIGAALTVLDRKRRTVVPVWSLTKQ